QLAREAVLGEERGEHCERGIGEGSALRVTRPRRRKPRRYEEPTVGSRSPQERIGERQLHHPPTGAGHVPPTTVAAGRAPGEIHASQAMPAARKACSIDEAIRSARSRVHQAKMLGPPPEMLAPSAPCSSAASLTGAKPRTRGARNGSTRTS